MSKKLYEENSIKAIADAIRQKNGSTDTYKLAAMAAAIEAIETGGGGLPTGIAMGEFKTTSETKQGGFQIEHGLGAMPTVVLVYLSVSQLVSQFVNAAMVVNLNEEYDEDTSTYYPNDSRQAIFYGKSSTLAYTEGTMEGDADRTYFYVPAINTPYMYPPAITYKWIAIALGG